MTLDATLSNFVSGYGAFDIAFLMAFISDVTFVVIVLSILPIIRGSKQAATDYLALIITAISVSIFFQQFFATPRPALAVASSPYSFPSTHSSASFAWAWFMGGRYKQYESVFYAFAVLVAISRVYLGVHYPIDVVAGAILGLGIAAGMDKLNRRGQESV